MSRLWLQECPADLHLGLGGWATMRTVDSAWENLKAITLPESKLAATMHPSAVGAGGNGLRFTRILVASGELKNTAHLDTVTERPRAFSSNAA